MRLTIINVLFLSNLIISIVGCNNNTQTHLYNKWKTVKLINAKMEAELLAMQTYIDTLGNQDPILKNDSKLVAETKQLLAQDLKNNMEAYQIAKENMLLEFLSNGMCYITTTDGVDSAMFHLEENFIKIDETKLKGYGETMTFEILSLKKDSLHLKLIDYGDTAFITMTPAL
jgi:hypothetical protein